MDKKVYIRYGHQLIPAVLWVVPEGPEDPNPSSRRHYGHCVWIEDYGEEWVNASRIVYLSEDTERGLRNTALFFQSKGSDTPDKVVIAAVKAIGFGA